MLLINISAIFDIVLITLAVLVALINDWTSQERGFIVNATAYIYIANFIFLFIFREKIKRRTRNESLPSLMAQR